MPPNDCKAADLAAGLDEKLTSLEADAATFREMRRTRAIGRELQLPAEGHDEVKREPPTKPIEQPSLDEQLAVAAEAMAATQASMRTEREVFNVPYSEAQRANTRLPNLTIFPEHHWPIYLNSGDDEFTEDGADGPIRLERLAQFEVWAAVKMKAGEKRAAAWRRQSRQWKCWPLKHAHAHRERGSWRKLVRVRLRRQA